MLKKIRQLLSDETGGAELIEATVAIPIFLIMVLGILGWSYFMFQLNIVQYATKQAARCAIIPKVNGSGLPWCGWTSNQTYQSYGVVNTFGLTVDERLFSQDPTITYTAGLLSYKYLCVKSSMNNPLVGVLPASLPVLNHHVALSIPIATNSSACRALQAQ